MLGLSSRPLFSIAVMLSDGLLLHRIHPYVSDRFFWEESCLAHRDTWARFLRLIVQPSRMLLGGNVRYGNPWSECPLDTRRHYNLGLSTNAIVQVGFQAVYHWHILSMTNQETVQGVVPYPLVGQEHHLRCKDQLTHQVKM